MPSAITQAAIAHFKAIGMQSVIVPEWKIDDAPVKLFWTPLTIDERSSLFKGDNAATKSDVDILIMKALDQNGQKVFSLEDKPFLLAAVEAHVIMRVAKRMIAGTSEDEIKN